MRVLVRVVALLRVIQRRGVRPRRRAHVHKGRQRLARMQLKLLAALSITHVDRYRLHGGHVLRRRAPYRYVAQRSDQAIQIIALRVNFFGRIVHHGRNTHSLNLRGVHGHQRALPCAVDVLAVVHIIFLQDIAFQPINQQQLGHRLVAAIRALRRQRVAVYAALGHVRRDRTAYTQRPVAAARDRHPLGHAALAEQIHVIRVVDARTCVQKALMVAVRVQIRHQIHKR